jgi:hypothetical protein
VNIYDVHSPALDHCSAGCRSSIKRGTDARAYVLANSASNPTDIGPPAAVAIGVRAEMMAVSALHNAPRILYQCLQHRLEIERGSLLITLRTSAVAVC